MKDMKDLLELLRKVGGLKKIDREGWKRVGIEDVESVADHTFRSALMALFLSERFGLDTDRLVKMLLIHDLGEVETGDITPYEDFSKEEKRSMEREALEKLLDPIEEKEELVELWQQFETGEEKEAKVARDIDRLERILQAMEYKEEYQEKDLSEFIVEGVNKFETQEIKELFDRFSLD